MAAREYVSQSGTSSRTSCSNGTSFPTRGAFADAPRTCARRARSDESTGRRPRPTGSPSNSSRHRTWSPAPWKKDPDLHAGRDLARALDLSLEASLRRYVDLHDQPLAAVWSNAGIVQTFAHSERFPWLAIEKANPLRPASRARRLSLSNWTGTTDMRETQPLAWLDRPDVEFFEQTRIGENGHAVTFLWATLEEDEAENQGPAPAPWEREDPPFGQPSRS